MATLVKPGDVRSSLTLVHSQPLSRPPAKHLKRKPVKNPAPLSRSIALMTVHELQAFDVFRNCTLCGDFDNCIIAQRMFDRGLAALAQPGNFDREAAMNCQTGRKKALKAKG